MTGVTQKIATTPTRSQALLNLVELRAKLNACDSLMTSICSNGRQARQMKELLGNIESYLTTPIKYLESEK